MIRVAVVLGVGLATMAQAETVRSNSFEAEIQRRAIAPLADGSPMSHLYVAVKTTSGALPAQAEMRQAAVFAAKAGCRNGTSLSTVIAGTAEGAAQFEVLCKGGR
jgi:uncharacterized RDD family membrane protein YckC